MNYIKKLSVSLLFCTAVLSINAQRNDRGGSERRSASSARSSGQKRQGNMGQAQSSRQTNSSYGRTTNQTVPSSTRDRNVDNNYSRNDNVYSNSNRSLPVNNSNRIYSNTSQQDQRVARNTNIVRSNNQDRLYDNYRGSYYSNNSYYGYQPRWYSYAGAPRYQTLPRSFITVSFGGYPYYYYGGCFYGYRNSFYEPVFAPVGIHITVLPPRYVTIIIGSRPYYYYEGIYYRRLRDGLDEYEVVDAPLGAQISSLPRGVTTTVINGEKFYEFNGTYYKETLTNRNAVVYTVVGKYGIVNNTEEAPESTLRQGDELDVLPQNSKEVTINGEVLYLTPDNYYLRAAARNNSTVYKVVGRGTAD